MKINESVLLTKDIVVVDIVRLIHLTSSLQPNISIANKTKIVDGKSLLAVLTLKLHANQIIQITVEHKNKKIARNSLDLIIKFIQKGFKF